MRNIKRLIDNQPNTSPISNEWAEWLLEVAEVLGIEAEEDGSGVFAFGSWRSWSKFYDEIWEEIEEVQNDK